MSDTRSIFSNSVFFLALVPVFALWGLLGHLLQSTRGERRQDEFLPILLLLLVTQLPTLFVLKMQAGRHLRTGSWNSRCPETQANLNVKE